ncbi:MAG: hypothetical protein CBB69_010260 [Phycisphaera sp. TMED9]|nr:MAG: hypothetical protein CBB69_010260 [Phycisphaera sp. TMED9]
MQPPQSPFPIGVLKTVFVTALALLVQSASGVDHVLAPTDAWPTSSAMSPGDRIYLTPGYYKDVPVITYRGSEASPITISSVDASQPATIVGGATWGLDVRGGQHIRISTLMVLSGQSGGIRLSRGDAGPASSIILEDNYVIPKPGDPTRVGIDLDGVEDVRLLNMRVDIWSRAAVQIRDGRNIEIRKLKIRGDYDAAIGVRVNDAVDGLRILESSLLTIGGSGIAVGMTTGPPPASKPETPMPPATRNVRIERCVIERVAIPFTVASASNVVCDHCTIVEPRSAAFELRAVPDGWASASDIQIQDNLIWWSVNGLKRFLIDEQPDGEFQLGSNLWWAAEMPAAIEWLGGFPTNAPPQVVDVDPKLIPRTARATDPAARGFGHLGIPKEPLPSP